MLSKSAGIAWSRELIKFAAGYIVSQSGIGKEAGVLDLSGWQRLGNAAYTPPGAQWHPSTLNIPATSTNTIRQQQALGNAASIWDKILKPFGSPYVGTANLTGPGGAPIASTSIGGTR